MLFYVCNIIINYNSKCIHPSRGARLMFCWTDFCFPWHQDQRGYKKYLTQNMPFPRPHCYCLFWYYIHFFSICWLDSRRVRWNEVLTKIYEFWIKYYSIWFFLNLLFFLVVESCVCTFYWIFFFVIWTFQTRKILTW